MSPTSQNGLNMSGNQNNLLATNGGQLFGSGAITFNTANFGNTVALGQGVWNLGANNISVGGSPASSNNTFSGAVDHVRRQNAGRQRQHCVK